MKSIYLYGAGGYGKAALDCFASYNALNLISGVIDNNPGLKNATIMGKRIFPYCDVKDRLDSNTTILISVELETAISISQQLKKDNKIRYLYWSYEQNSTFNDLVELTQIDNDYFIFSHSLSYEIKILEGQKKYLLQNYNPRYFKKAEGNLRDLQLQLVQFAHEIVIEANREGIRPFLSSGNLLGYIRHGGFIPWDDDFDLTIVRKEYNKLRNLFMDSYYYSRYNGPLNDDNIQIKWIKKEMDSHLGETIVLERPMLFRICKKSLDGEYLLVDLFPFDGFKEESSYYRRLATLQANKSLLSTAETVDDYYKVISKIAKDDEIYRTDDGNYMGYGYDVRESYSSSKYHGYIERSLVFPLNTIKYEEHEFQIPNNPDAFLNYEFGANYMELPQSIGLHFSTDIFK